MYAGYMSYVSHESVNWSEPIVEGKKQYFRIRKRFYRIERNKIGKQRSKN